MRPPRWYNQRPLSEIKNLYKPNNFTPFIRLLKPFMFIFSLLIFHPQIKVFFKFVICISVIRMLIKEQLLTSAIVIYLLRRHSIYLEQSWGFTPPR